MLEHTASLYPDEDALVFPQLKLRWSWRELDERVNQAAAWLIELGVDAGRARRHLVDERSGVDRHVSMPPAESVRSS